MSQHPRGLAFSGLEVVTWRRTGCCRSRLLRVLLSPRGWHVLGDDFRVPPAEWLRRLGGGEAPEVEGAPLTMDRIRAGEVAVLGLRKVDGVARLLPLLTESWEGATIEVGCDHCRGTASLSWLAEDCERAKAATRAVTRPVECGCAVAST